MRGIDSAGEKERFVVLLLELVDGPVHPHRVSHLFLFPFRHSTPLEKEAAGYFSALVINTRRKICWKRRLFAPRIKRPSPFALTLGSKEEFRPVSLVDRTGRMVEELSCSEGGVAAFREAGLQRFGFRTVYEVVSRGVAAGRRSKLSRENRRAGRGAEDAGGMCVGEVHTTRCKFVNVRSNRPRADGRSGTVEAADPVIHVIDGEKKHVWLRFRIGDAK